MMLFRYTIFLQKSRHLIAMFVFNCLQACAVATYHYVIICLFCLLYNYVLIAYRAMSVNEIFAMQFCKCKWPKTVSGLPSTSGTTSSIAFIRRQKLYIGHVGDSKIVLGYQLPGSREWCPCALTKDHKPESPEERERINSAGGLVLNKAGVERVVWNRPRPGHKGPVRRSTLFDQIPFLAVARSLGDLWSYNYSRDEFVVSPDPDVKVININPQVHRCVIFASDGLWNMVSNVQAVRIVQTAEEENEKLILDGSRMNGVSSQPKNPSKLLVDTALNHWFELGMRADNTSVVTVMLDPPGPPKSEVLLRQRVMKRLRPRDELLEESSDAKNLNAFDTPPSVVIKEKKRPNENFESPPPKERKRFSDFAPENVCKEKKLSSDSDEPVPKNLPKPVILSPQRVVVKQTVTPGASAPILSPENSNPTAEKLKTPEPSVSNQPLLQPKSKRKGHDPPGDGVDDNNSILSRNKSESRNNTLSESSNNTSENNDESVTKSMLSENGKDKINSLSNVIVGRTESCLSKCEKEDSSPPNDTNCKENGWSHLDNFYTNNDRTSDIENSASTKQISVTQKNKVVPCKIKQSKKSTLAQRTFPMSRRLRLHRTNLSSGKTNTTRRSYTHNTRAQSGIRKMKV
ncbi:protein phosphatase 1D isoform X2 [Parasteatoda tepidariorum]|uniref:protein phosphatase 1D isoform X2 n=1 Tax=Parasteatoda tepidariorum TaxID=114398 RepID=UPI0039BC570F